MYPTLYLFWFELDSYRTLFILWWLIYCLITFYNIKNLVPSSKVRIWILIIVSISAIIWARIFHFFLYSKYYFDDLIRLYNSNLQGQAVMWGLIAWVLSIYILSKVKRFDFLKIADANLPWIWIWIAIWRIWCLLAWCCFWKETNQPLGLKFPILSPAHKLQLSKDPSWFFDVHSVYPTQIFEFFAAISIIIVYVIAKKLKFNKWVAFYIAIIVYCLERILISQYRAEAMTYNIPNWTYTIIYFTIISLSIFKLIRFQKT